LKPWIPGILIALLAAALSADETTANPALERAVVLVRTLNSLRSTRGSGFIVGDGSWVVTASHVVSVDLGKGKRASDRTALVYSPWTGRPQEAQIVAVDAEADVALLRLKEPGLPSLPLEGIDVTDAAAALTALTGRTMRLYGFPLTYGEATVASLARPESNDAKLKQIARRGETNLCVLNECPGAQPGWSGGPIVSIDRSAVVGVFHSLYRPEGGNGQGFPAGSLTGYLGALLRKAGASDVDGFARAREPALPASPGAPELMAMEMRSLSWSAGGRWDKAEEEQREIVKQLPKDVLSRVELGRILLQLKKTDEAVTVLQEAAALGPTSVLAHLTLGRAHYQAYDPSSAIRSLQRAGEISPGEIEPRLALAEVYEASGKPDLAESTLRAVLKDDAAQPVAQFQLGQLLIRTGKPDDGLKILSQAGELARSDAVLSFIPLGQARALETARKFKDAETAYRMALKVDPENASAHYYLTLFYFKQRRLEDAQLQLNVAIRMKSLSDDMLEAFRALQAKINERGGG